MQKFSGKITISQLIIGIVALAFALSLASSAVSSYRGNIQLLQQQALEKNVTYVAKLAQTINLSLKHNGQILKYSASHIAEHMDDEEILQQEVDRLLEQNLTFNSVAIANPEGVILVGAPYAINLKGKKISSKQGLELIKNQRPAITDPYRASTGNDIITVSHPIFSKEGEYKGVLNGTVYIRASDLFASIIGEHAVEDDSYVYVVDSVGRLIYHPNHLRIGEDVSANEAVKKLIAGESGSVQTTNKQGIDMLAAYMPIANTKWGIVVQTPTESAIEPVGHQLFKMIQLELPLMLLSMLIVSILAWLIVKPLKKIALLAEHSIRDSELQYISNLNAWYYEASQIKNALLQSFTVLYNQVHVLRDQTTIDPLTQLTNRRGLDTVLQSWTSIDKPFSIILLDLDHFKSVNDTYGHHMGDEVLKFTAAKMKQVTSEQDICCRYGGEEFLIVLPDTDDEQAYKIAENLQHLIRQSKGPVIIPITFSAGVASFPKHAIITSELLHRADKALYKAKKAGRNRIIIVNESNEKMD